MFKLEEGFYRFIHHLAFISSLSANLMRCSSSVRKTQTHPLISKLSHGYCFEVQVKSRHDV